MLTLYTSQGTRIDLSDKHHIATGGEGSVYIKDGLAYKVYTDPTLALKNGMDQKWQLLHQVQHPSLITPLDMLVDKKHQFAGLVFPAVSGSALCEAFSTAWWTRNGFDIKQCQQSIKNMQETVGIVHQHQALIVDGNEMNWLLNGTQPYLLDTDSWQIGPFKPTAIMPSIQDHHTKGFSEASDWYAWAIVTFQLWTGIHPFKGNHPVYGRAWQDRMQHCASLFDKDVKLPNAVRDMSNIPPALLAWYKDMFSTKNRSAPPWVYDAVNSTVKKVLSNVKTLKLSIAHKATGKLKGVIYGFALYEQVDNILLRDIAFGTTALLSKSQGYALLSRAAGILRTETGLVLCSTLPTKQLHLENLTTRETGVIDLHCDQVWQAHNKLFTYRADGEALQEVKVFSGNQHLFGNVNNWPLLVQSSKFFKNLIVQQLYNKTSLVLVEDAGMQTVPAWCLDEYHVLDGQFVDKHNIWVVAKHRISEEYQILHLTMDNLHVNITETFNVNTPDLNMGVTLNKVGILQIEDNLCIFAGNKQQWIQQETLRGTLLSHMPNMYMIDDDGNLVRIEKTA